MNEPDPVPIYTPTPGTTDLHALSKSHNLALPVTRCPSYDANEPSPPLQTERSIIHTFFTAISTAQSSVVATMLDSNLVSPATTDHEGCTPLIAATAAGHVRMVRELVDSGAEVDAWGAWRGRERTALMVAATEGNLTLVKLFVEVFRADDGLIAPDGQMALRLAVEAGRTEVVEFLPARRGGGLKRLEVQHAVAVSRARKAVVGVCHFFRVLVWSIPRFFVWTLPKEGVVEPVGKLAGWCWKNRGGFGPWLKRKVRELPGKAKRAAEEFVAWTRKFLTEILPRVCKAFGKYCRSLLTVRIPAALKAFGDWLQKGVKAFGHSVLFVASRIASFLHTFYTAVVSFFHNLTLKDIWNGFRDILRAVFVDFPAKIWEWAQKFGEMSYHVMEKLGGFAGELAWVIVRIIAWIAAYVPKKIWVIISSLGGSAAKGWHELMVWIDPKK